MFLSDRTLKYYCENHELITPYNSDNVNPASIDLCFSRKYRMAIKSLTTTNASTSIWSKVYSDSFIVLERGDLYLLDTLETIKVPNNWIGFLFLKSSLGRQGLEHLHAGLFDPGFNGTATLEIENRHPEPLVIKAGQPIVQIAFALLDSEAENPYNGKYQGQNEPQVNK